MVGKRILFAWNGSTESARAISLAMPVLSRAESIDVLDALGVQAVGLQKQFVLSETPDIKTLKVTARYPCGTDTDLLKNVCTSSPMSTCSGSISRRTRRMRPT